MLPGCYVPDNADYAAVTDGLTDLRRETGVFFDTADVDAGYTSFSKPCSTRLRTVPAAKSCSGTLMTT